MAREMAPKLGHCALTHNSVIHDSESSSDGFELIDATDAALDDNALAAIRHWLQTTDYEADSSEYNRHLQVRAPETGLWICDTDKYRSWHSSEEHGSLWIKDVPGAGKSVTAAAIAKNLQETEEAPVLTFFFRYVVLANRTPRGLVKDWLSQLLTASVRLQHDLQTAQSRELDAFSDEQLWAFLLSGLSDVRKVYCLVDALDEMDMQAENSFLNRLNSLSTFRPNAVKILITSRPEQYLQRSLPEVSIIHISLERDLVGLDIARFVENELKKFLPSPSHQLYRDRAGVAIVERCDGLFLYAKLLLDQILPSLGSGVLPDAKKLVTSLPLGLESMYNSMLHRQATSLGIDQGIQKFILEAATHCIRPLRLSEIAHALKCAFPRLLASTSKDLVRSACAPLIEILEDETVQVIHHSLTEFLLDSKRQEVDTQSGLTSVSGHFPVLVPTIVHKDLALLCLRYLQFNLVKPANCAQASGQIFASDGAADGSSASSCGDNLNHEDHDYNFDYKEARLQHPFLEYATTNWAYHAAKYDVNDADFFEAITTFLQPTNRSCLRWMSIEWPGRDSAARLPSILHIAAFAGLTQMAKTLKIRSMIDEVDADHRTPLHWASRRGFGAIAALLLENGANAEARDIYGLQPVHEAAKRNHHQIVKLLLEGGSDPLAAKGCEHHDGAMCCSSTSSLSTTPLRYACTPGHVETLLAMIPFLRRKELQEALCRACHDGHTESVHCLLENSNVSVDDTFRQGLPIVLATGAYDAVSVQLLLEHGADVNGVSASEFQDVSTVDEASSSTITILQMTALHRLSCIWDAKMAIACSQIFKILIKAGADVNLLDDDGMTPLDKYLSNHYIEQQAFERTTLLAYLSAGARFKDEKHDGVLCRALEIIEDPQALQDLLDHGACIDYCGKGGATVLHSALTRYFHSLPRIMAAHEMREERRDSQSKTFEIIRFLLDRGARLEATDDRGRSALSIGAHFWERDMQTFKFLFQACSNPKAREGCIWYLKKPDLPEDLLNEYLNLLLDGGVSLEVQNYAGQTPILAFAAFARIRSILIKAGARVDAVDSDGFGLLHTFISRRAYERKKGISEFQQLVSLGLDLATVAKNGNGLLHLLAQRWHYDGSWDEMIQYLIAQGLHPDTRNVKGQSTLHVFMASTHDYLQPLRGSMRADRDINSYNGTVAGQWLDRFLALLKGSEFDINARDSDGLTALHMAASSDAVKFAHLLNAGADILTRDNNQRTVLHIASATGQANIVGHILDIAGEGLLSSIDLAGRTALHEACAGGHTEVVHILLTRSPSLDVKDGKGRTPLHSCADSELDYSMPEICALLIDAGAEPCVQDSLGNTALDLAVSQKRKAMVRYLAQRFEDVNKISSCSERARYGGRTRDELRKRLHAQVALLSRLESSVMFLQDADRVEIIRKVDEYADQLYGHDILEIKSHIAAHPEAFKDFWASGFLQRIVETGRVDLMKHLVDQGKFLENRDGSHAMQLKYSPEQRYEFLEYDPIVAHACERRMPNLLMLKLLVEEHGFSHNLPKSIGFEDHSSSTMMEPGRFPLHVLAKAHSWWQINAAKYLIEKGALVEARDHLGRTPLHIASDELVDQGAQSNSRGLGNLRKNLWKPSFVRLLLDSGADPNALNKFGQSPLHMACMSPETMRLLLERGASPTCGRGSPIFPAIQQQNVETLRILLDAGCDPNSVDTGDLEADEYSQPWTRCALLRACLTLDYIRNIEHSLPLIPLLLEHGANVYYMVGGDRMLLHYIFEKAEFSVVRSFLDNYKYVDYTTCDERGFTVLHAACTSTLTTPGDHNSSGKCKVQSAAAALVFSGLTTIDLRALDFENKSMLHHLLDNLKMEDETILEILEHSICQEIINWEDGYGYTAVQYALRKLRPWLVEALLRLNADPLAADPTGSTGLHHIAKHALCDLKIERNRVWYEDVKGTSYTDKSRELWQCLLQQGAELECRDSDGNTPLLAYLAGACIHTVFDRECDTLNGNCHVDFYGEYLADANIHARNNAGETALHVIARRQPMENTATESQHSAALFDFMVKKGLDPLEEDDEGRTALDVAAAWEKENILKLFRCSS